MPHSGRTNAKKWAGTQQHWTHCAGGQPFYLQLRAGVAGILLDGLTGDSIFYTTPEEAASTGKASAVGAEDDRAELVLQLLLAGLDAPAPNVGHMLLGFDVEHGPEGVDCCTSLLCLPSAGAARWLLPTLHLVAPCPPLAVSR